PFSLVAGSGAPGELRSFPTRRSSDLAWAALLVLGLALVVLGIVLADRLARAVTGPIGGLARVSHRLAGGDLEARAEPGGPPEVRDRKSTRLNSSHVKISYAVFCLKKK